MCGAACSRLLNNLLRTLLLLELLRLHLRPLLLLLMMMNISHRQLLQKVCSQACRATLLRLLLLF